MCGELSVAFQKISLEAGAEVGVHSEGGRDAEGARDDQGGLIEELRGLLVETMAGREGGNSGPPLRIVVRAVETRTVTTREVVGGRFGHVPRIVETEEVMTREVDARAAMESAE